MADGRGPADFWGNTKGGYKAFIYNADWYQALCLGNTTPHGAMDIRQIT